MFAHRVRFRQLGIAAFFCLRIVFFMRVVHFGRFQIILSNAVRDKFREKIFDVADYEALTKIFQFVDGVSDENCFAFVSTLPPSEEPDEKFSEDAELPSNVDNKSDPSKKVLQIAGNGCKRCIRLDGEGFDGRAVAYRIVFSQRENRNVSAKFMAIFYCNLRGLSVKFLCPRRSTRACW